MMYSPPASRRLTDTTSLGTGEGASFIQIILWLDSIPHIALKIKEMEVISQRVIEFFIVPLIAGENRHGPLNSLAGIYFSADSDVTLGMISINGAFSVVVFFYRNVINFYCFGKATVGGSTDSCIVLQLLT